MDNPTFSVSLDLEERFRFQVDFGMNGVPVLGTDEPPPLGDGSGPNPARLLAAAVGNCLAASMAFCLNKSRIPLESLHATVEGTMVRNERGRLRIGALHVTLEPTVAAGAEGRLARCAELYEDFCIVTQSVREGIDIAVDIKPATVAETIGA